MLLASNIHTCGNVIISVFYWKINVTSDLHPTDTQQICETNELILHYFQLNLPFHNN